CRAHDQAIGHLMRCLLMRAALFDQRSGVLFTSDSEAVGEPADLSLRGFQQSAGDGSDRGPFGKSLGYRVKGGGRKVGRIEDREDRLPSLRLEFRFKRIQTVKVVEPFAMRPHP